MALKRVYPTRLDHNGKFECEVRSDKEARYQNRMTIDFASEISADRLKLCLLRYEKGD